jgi:phosphatidylethanolamine-binding protein (PEBP) family uncharacterized protein
MSKESEVAAQTSNVKPMTEAVVLKVGSPSFKDKEMIPVRFTCNGENINPAITIDNIPTGTRSLTLVVLAPQV